MPIETHITIQIPGTDLSIEIVKGERGVVLRFHFGTYHTSELNLDTWYELVEAVEKVLDFFGVSKIEQPAPKPEVRTSEPQSQDSS